MSSWEKIALSVCVCVCLCVYVCLCVFMCVYVCLCVFMCVYVCFMCVYVCLCVFMCVYVCLCVFMCLCSERSNIHRHVLIDEYSGQGDIPSASEKRKKCFQARQCEINGRYR